MWQWVKVNVLVWKKKTTDGCLTHVFEIIQMFYDAAINLCVQEFIYDAFKCEQKWEKLALVIECYRPTSKEIK